MTDLISAMLVSLAATIAVLVLKVGGNPHAED